MLQAQFETKSTIEVMNGGLDLLEGSNVAVPELEDAGNLVSETDDARINMKHLDPPPPPKALPESCTV